MIWRIPRLFLLGFQHRVTEQQPTEIKKNPVVLQFDIAKISDAEIIEQPAYQKQDFDLNVYIDSQGLDYLALTDREGNLCDSRFNIVLEIEATGKSPVPDLKLNKLSPQQEFMEVTTGLWRLVVPEFKITHQLINWIMQQIEYVTVIEPKILRDEIKRKIVLASAKYK